MQVLAAAELYVNFVKFGSYYEFDASLGMLVIGGITKRSGCGSHVLQG
jgi:hypothetical protein